MADPLPSTVDGNAPSTATWRLMYAPATVHFSHDPRHQYVWAVGIERQAADHGLLGASYFSNSFGQPSGYVYGGERLFPFSDARFYAQWTAGLIYGYRGEFAHKVPLNYHGFSPGFVVSAGWQFDSRLSAQLNLLGISAVMLQLNLDLP